MIQRRRQWINVEPALIQRFVSAVLEQQFQYKVTTDLLTVRTVFSPCGNLSA